MFGLFGWKEFGSESIASICVIKGLFTNKQVSIQIHSTMKNHKTTTKLNLLYYLLKFFMLFQNYVKISYTICA